MSCGSFVPPGFKGIIVYRSGSEVIRCVFFGRFVGVVPISWIFVVGVHRCGQVFLRVVFLGFFCSFLFCGVVRFWASYFIVSVVYTLNVLFVDYSS